MTVRWCLRGVIQGLLVLALCQLSGCWQSVDPGGSDGGKIVQVKLGTEYQDVVLDEVSSSATITLDQLALAAWPDADLSSLGADLVGAQGFRPASKSTCRGLIPIPGELLGMGMVDVQTANLTWDDGLGYSGCMQVRGLEKLILLDEQDEHVTVDLVLGQSKVGVDLRFQPTQDIDSEPMVALDGIVTASGITQSADLYHYDLESAQGRRPVQDLAVAPVELSALHSGFVSPVDGSLFWQTIPDDDDTWDLGTLKAIYLLDRGGEPISVQVVMGEEHVQVQLGSLDTLAVGGERLVPLQEVISASKLAADPGQKVFDFEGLDGFRPSVDKGLEPLSWQELASGWIHPVTGSLTWDSDASIPSAWRVSSLAKVHILDP